MFEAKFIYQGTDFLENYKKDKYSKALNEVIDEKYKRFQKEVLDFFEIILSFLNEVKNKIKETKSDEKDIPNKLRADIYKLYIDLNNHSKYLLDIIDQLMIKIDALEVYQWEYSSANLLKKIESMEQDIEKVRILFFTKNIDKGNLILKECFNQSGDEFYNATCNFYQRINDLITNNLNLLKKFGISNTQIAADLFYKIYINSNSQKEQIDFEKFIELFERLKNNIAATKELSDQGGNLWRNFLSIPIIVFPKYNSCSDNAILKRTNNVEDINKYHQRISEVFEYLNFDEKEQEHYNRVLNGKYRRKEKLNDVVQEINSKISYKRREYDREIEIMYRGFVELNSNNNSILNFLPYNCSDFDEKFLKERYDCAHPLDIFYTCLCELFPDQKDQIVKAINYYSSKQIIYCINEIKLIFDEYRKAYVTYNEGPYGDILYKNIKDAIQDYEAFINGRINLNEQEVIDEVIYQLNK